MLEKIHGSLFMEANKNYQKMIVFFSINTHSVKPNFFLLEVALDTVIGKVIARFLLGAAKYRFSQKHDRLQNG